MSAPLTPPLTPPASGVVCPSTTEFKNTFFTVQKSLPTPPDTPAQDAEGLKFQRLSVSSIDSVCSAGKVSESERPLSDNELSYFLPSRADGVNDMYLHHKLTVPTALMDKERIAHLWALFLLRHPLLASHVSFQSYEDVSFVHPQPSSYSAALHSADERYVYLDEEDSELDIIDTYLNGPRSLSSDRLAMLVVAHKGGNSYEMMLCATHYLGDGMALHTFMNEFYTSLGDSNNTIDYLSLEISQQITEITGLPTSLEDRMPVVGTGSKFAKAIGAIDNKRNDSKLIGGQAFPGNKTKMERYTVVPTFAYSATETKKILGACKVNGATIAHAMFALCNVAWARRISREKRVDPCLIYSALNLRPNMQPTSQPESYFHLAVGYFNIVLPTLLPSTLTTSEIFWHRARETKKQTIKAVKSQFVVSRSRETNKIRRDRAVKWAAIDDAEEAAKATNDNAGLGFGNVGPTRAAPAPIPAAVTPAKTEKSVEPKIAPVRAEQTTPPTTPPASAPQEQKGSKVPILAPASQRALMGVSMLGNLDGMYKHAGFGDIVLKSLTTGSRQRPGGLLLFAYTFAGKLWLSLGYDQNGFEEGVIPAFWQEMQDVVREVLL